MDMFAQCDKFNNSNDENGRERKQENGIDFFRVKK